MGRFGPLDADTNLFDKDETIRTIASYYSAEVDTSGFMNSDDVCSLGLAVDFADLGSAGGAKVMLTIRSSTTATATDIIWTSQTFTLAEAQAAFAGADGFIMPIPNSLLSNYTRINFAVTVADLNAGVLNAGLVPMPT